jgi:hypothetical protein
VGARAARAVAAALVAVALGASAAAAAPPKQGVLVPGRSLGGIRIGMTKADVRLAWGTAFGRCRECLRETWYFNYVRFEPQGAGVIFRRGRVVHVFTIWQPQGWHTANGLTLGAGDYEVTRTYGALQELTCAGYSAFVLRGSRAQTVFYVDGGKLWGFGLTRPESSPCV